MSTFKLKPPLLCLITDPTVADLLPKVELALAAGVNMLQLRGHELSGAQLYALAQALSPLTRRYNAAFIVNDRLDVGLAIGADGFQLGMRSLPLAVARQLIGGSLLGASIHTVDEAHKAVAQGADFLLAGTIFPSRSHPTGPISGLELLRMIKQNLPTSPLIALGGITERNASQVMDAGADGIAVISAILHSPHISTSVQRLRTIIEKREGNSMSEIPDQPDTLITVIANSQPYKVPENSTIADLLRTLNITAQRVVIQMDGTIIPRTAFDQTALHEGCKLEIVTIVGGG